MSCLFHFPGCRPPARPDREAVAIQVDRVTVVSLPALPPDPPAPTLTIVSDGCGPCRAGQTLNAYTVVHNPTADLIIAEYRASVSTPHLNEGAIEWVSDLYALPLGDTTLPLTGRWSVPEGIPAGSYRFEARLLDPQSGRTLAVERFRVEKSE